MSDEEDTKVEISQEEYQALLNSTRESQAKAAGLDPTNPMHSLVMEKVWQPGMSSDAFVEALKPYGVLQEPGTPNDNPPSTSTDEAESRELSALSGGTNNLPDIQSVPDPSKVAVDTYVNLTTKEHLPAEDARVAAYDQLLTHSGKRAALSRIRSRQEEERQAAAFYADNMSR